MHGAYLDSLRLDELPIPISDALHFADDSYTEVTYCEKEVECWVEEFDSHTIVAYRGTEGSGIFSKGGWRDLTRDIRAFPWKDKRIGWCHAGFLKGARRVVDKHLMTMVSRAKPVIFIGHSLGGALSVISAILMKLAGFNVTGLITFGAPRALYKSAYRVAKSLKIPTWQFSNPGDPVADMPAKFLGCYHLLEIETDREARGYSIGNNHMMNRYYEAFEWAM
jgi:hypothetical protein